MPCTHHKFGKQASVINQEYIVICYLATIMLRLLINMMVYISSRSSVAKLQHNKFNASHKSKVKLINRF